YTGHDRPLGQGERARYRELVARRLGGEPVAYLIGRREFWSLSLAVDARVLVPRPETEHVVEQVLRVLPAQGTLVDVGTGSGAIALAVRKERPGARVLATEREPGALEVARANAERLALAVEFFAGDLLEPVRTQGPFAVIASNPPYIPTGRLAGLPAEVQAEPRAAL